MVSKLVSIDLPRDTSQNTMPDNQTASDKKRPAEEAEPASAKAPATGQPKRKRLKRKHVDPAVYEFRRVIQMSCKDNDLGRALKAFTEAKKNGTQIEASTYYSLLSLCVADRSLHIGVPREREPVRPKKTTADSGPEGGEVNDSDGRDTDKKDGTDPELEAQPKDDEQATEPPQEEEEIALEERKRIAFEIKSEMDKARIPLSEAAYTPVIKLLSKAGDLEQANTILLEAEKVQQCKPKLRLYSYLLQAYAEAGKVLDALRIWYMITQQKLVVSEKEYTALMRCAVVCQSATLMESVLTDLAEDVPVPSRDTTNAIIDWFESSAASETVTSDADETEIVSFLEKIHQPQENAIRMISQSMGLVQSSTGWTISRDCTIDTSNGSLTSGCLQGESLRAIGLAPETWEDMVKANETIVTSGQLEEHQSPFLGGHKGPKRKTDDIKGRRKNWERFLKYLEERKAPIDVVVDGANVGYYEQNFSGAPKHVSYIQIDWVVDTLRKQGKSVLLVMHSRHFSPKLLPRKFQPIVDKWIKDGVLYQTPPGMDDDWFWMHIALTRPGTLMVTNDRLRDHHFQLMSPRCFLRWRERHQVSFDFGEIGDRRVRFTFADPYSRRVQRVADGLVVPLPKLGDENRFLDGCIVAEEGVPKAETYLCIRPKT